MYFGANAKTYVDAFLRNVDWQGVQGRYEDAVKVAPPRPLIQDEFADVPSIGVEEVKAMIAAKEPVQVTVVTESEMAWLFIAAGLVAMITRAPPRWLRRDGLNLMMAADASAGSGIASTVDWGLLTQIGVFFAEAGAFVFGSGLAIVPFLYGGVVTERHWLTERQFVDAVAVAMITPGPVVITVAFIGYLIQGLPGAFIAALCTFLPCCLFTVIPAPYLAGVTLLLLWRFRRLQEPALVAGAAIIGVIVYHCFTVELCTRGRISTV